MDTRLRLDYRLRQWAPTSTSRAFSELAELIVLLSILFTQCLYSRLPIRFLRYAKWQLCISTFYCSVRIRASAATSPWPSPVCIWPLIPILHGRHGQDKTVLSCNQFSLHRRHGQDSFVLSVSKVWNRPRHDSSLCSWTAWRIGVRCWTVGPRFLQSRWWILLDLLLITGREWRVTDSLCRRSPYIAVWLLAFVILLSAIRLAVWHSGSMSVLINKVALRRARLVLGWVTVSGFQHSVRKTYFRA